jgi:hypothetical protein
MIRNVYLTAFGEVVLTEFESDVFVEAANSGRGFTRERRAAKRLGAEIEAEAEREWLASETGDSA